jgi:hypothetical protein
MRLVLVASIAASIMAIAETASALPGPDGRFRPGANHHLGDDSFVARFGRLPTAADDEHVRMQLHLAFVRAWLAARPATGPELAGRRAELQRFAHRCPPQRGHRSRMRGFGYRPRRGGLHITPAQQLALIQLLGTEGHNRDLAVALKNASTR